MDDLKTGIRVLRNSLVVFHSKSDAFLARVFTSRLQRIHRPSHRLLNSGSRWELARENTQVRRAKRFGNIHPFLDFLQDLGAFARFSLHGAGSDGGARKTYAVFEGQMPQRSQVGRVGGLEPISGHIHAINAQRDGVSNDVFHGHFAGAEKFAVRVSAATREQPRRCCTCRLRVWRRSPRPGCSDKFRASDDPWPRSSQKVSAVNRLWRHGLNSPLSWNGNLAGTSPKLLKARFAGYWSVSA